MGNILKYFEIKGAYIMAKDENTANETVEANVKINEQLEDGKVHASTERRSAAESANLEMHRINSEVSKNSPLKVFRCIYF